MLLSSTQMFENLDLKFSPHIFANGEVSSLYRLAKQLNQGHSSHNFFFFFFNKVLVLEQTYDGEHGEQVF